MARQLLLACFVFSAIFFLTLADGSCRMENGLLAGKVVIVTGATSGIGRVTAIEAAREGAKVVVAGRREAKGNAVVDEIKEAGGDAIFIQTDVTVEDSVKNMVDKTVEIYGRLDGAFNNAGWGAFSPLADFSVETYDGMFDTNVKGVMLSTKYEAEAMKKNGAEGGSIVNHASIAAMRNIGPAGVYSATKAAVWHFSNVAAAELGPANIRVNTMNTGFIPDTEIFDKVMPNEDAKQGFLQTQVIPKVPMGRTGEPVEIAGPVIFLLSNMASYITGDYICADGGYTL